MNRSGYSDDMDDPLAFGRWRGAVSKAINGKEGQAFINELIQALDALPEKKLVAGELQQGNCFCALGAVGKMRGMDLADIDPDDYLLVAEKFKIPRSLAQEIMFVNDECFYSNDLDGQRWYHVRLWARNNLKESEA